MGGGEVSAEVHPSKLTGVHLSERGAQKDARVISVVSNLPISAARRQLDSALQMLEAEGMEVSYEIVDAPSPGKGSAIFILTEFEKTRAGFPAMGGRSIRAEKVAV